MSQNIPEWWDGFIAGFIVQWVLVFVWTMLMWIRKGIMEGKWLF